MTKIDKKIGENMHKFAKELFGITRSITGDGVRETLSRINKRVPVQIHEVPSGTKVFDWTIPDEWNIKDAWVKDSRGRKVIDFRKNNLHVVSYSVPIHKKISAKEFNKHLFSLADQPDRIPYRTSYYEKNWGFSIAHKERMKLKDRRYKVMIDSTLKSGHLTYGEYFKKGETTDEILISAHLCHPSLANDNLSGVTLATFLAKLLSKTQTHYSYRFLFIPGTIGSITWLARNESRVEKIKHGLVLSGVGDSGDITYKKSRMGNAEIDRAAEHVLRQSGKPYKMIDFYPFGYDERQYCSPHFNLPIGTLMRSKHGEYPEYHTSADKLSFIKPDSLSDSFSKCVRILDLLEKNRTYLNLYPKGEPQLGRHGLYKAMAQQAAQRALEQMCILWVLNLSDGKHSLLDIAQRAGLKFDLVAESAKKLFEHRLLKEKKS